MGGAAPVADRDVPDTRPLPCDDADHWQLVAVLGSAPPVADLKGLAKRMQQYCRAGGELRGLEIALDEPGGEEAFFKSTLPYIIRTALALPELRERLPGGALPMLRQGQRRQLRLDRGLVASLLANMFLCTFDAPHAALPGEEAMPWPSFLDLHTTCAPSELAKLRMILRYFERAAGSEPQGEVVIDRVVGVALGEEQWLGSEKPLLPMEMAPPRVGFETAPELAHADFANMFIGGGVLSGGCVQEEIRFAICPELCVSMLVCPCMQAEEAIQIVGAEQFAAYSGYARSLADNGDFHDPADRSADGSVHVAVLAMDALDLRGCDSSLAAQAKPDRLMRDLNKSLAAFTPVDAASLERYPMIATGNWGCGAFNGCAPLKALVQWASASQCDRRLRYFPFEQAFGPELEALVAQVAGKASVGDLLRALWEIGHEERSIAEGAGGGPGGQGPSQGGHAAMQLDLDHIERGRPGSADTVLQRVARKLERRIGA